MGYNQDGPNSTANFSEYNDVGRDQYNSTSSYSFQDNSVDGAHSRSCFGTGSMGNINITYALENPNFRKDKFDPGDYSRSPGRQPSNDVGDVAVLLLRTLNKDVEGCASTFAGKYSRKYHNVSLAESALSQFPGKVPRAITDFIRLGISRNLMGNDFIVPCLQSLLNHILFENIFRPFSPYLNEEKNLPIQSLYAVISRKETPEHQALWRSMTYSACIANRNNEAEIMSLINQVHSTWRDFMSLLLPTGTPGQRPIIPKELLRNIILEAVNLQDCINIKYVHANCSVFLPSPASPFDEASMTQSDVNASKMGSELLDDGSESNRRIPVILTALALGLRTSGDTGKASETLVKASVVCKC